jgi:iron complex transport system ATP-binding protein
MGTHNPEHAFLFAGRILALHNGKIAADGPPADVLDADMIRALYGIEVRLRRDEAGGMSCIPIAYVVPIL